MSLFVQESLPWTSPVAALLQLARDEHCFVFLHSANNDQSGRYSTLALYPQEIIAGEDFLLLEESLKSGSKLFENRWFGYLGYELLHAVETIPRAEKSYITLPDLWFAQFGLVLIFDHQAMRVTAYRSKDIKLPEWKEIPSPALTPPTVESLASSMSRNEYLRSVERTKEAIARGDFYQANITRKFIGQFAQEPDLFCLFLRLIEASPSAYSAFIRMGDAAILSSSPECFLKVDALGRMESIPIKGTAPRFADKAKDEASRHFLETSEKERAENLMIVDLMRNDFSRSCETGSVKTERLFDISSYTTLHHMASTVTGQKRADLSTLEAIKNCFPPGSMTGAPKVQVMKWCREQEHIRRGVYSGALGWLDGDGSCELSVVIRTLIVDGNRFEFQVGGGITSGSEAESEWQETITKARGIMAALGLDVKRLETI